jgi:predicted lipoprotein with Yx(FWY)xxD motif
MKTRVLTLCIALGLVAAIVATAQARAPKSAVVTLKKTSLGAILVDPRGRTLYLFEKDEKGVSACNSACLSYWPAFTSRTVPRAGAGVHQSLLGLAKPQHGLQQVTYAGHPLYTFVGDKRSGQTTGEGLRNFGAEWYALAASGRKVDRSEGTSSSPPAPSGGYGNSGGGW